MTILEALSQIRAHIVGIMSQTFVQHLSLGFMRLRNKARALLDCVSGLPDCLDHESVGTKAQFLSSGDGTLLQFIRKFQ